MSPTPSACRPCARAKARCVYEPDSSTSRCLRCVRLRKECTSQNPVKPRAPLPRTRFDQLEKRVDALFNAVSSHDPVESSHENSNSNIILTEAARPMRRSKPGAGRAGKNSYSEQLNPPAPPPSVSAQATSDSDIWPHGEEAESLVFIYCQELSSHFPFVVPPKKQTGEIRDNQPFLFKAMVMAASYQTISLQQHRGDTFTSEIAVGLLVNGIKTLDLLQGLLVHIAWYHFHLTPSSQITNLLQLAIALLADLGLNKPGHVNDRRKLIFDNSRSSYGFSTSSQPLTNEERRALLGCFYVSSMISTAFRRVNALEYTAYMGRELQELLDSAEYPEDDLLGYLVRVQHIVEQVNQVASYDDLSDCHCWGPPMMMNLQTMSKGLCDLNSAIPRVWKNNDLLSMQHHAANIFVYEIGLYSPLWKDSLDITLSHRTSIMWSCLQATESFFQSFLAVSPHHIMTLPYSIWAQLAHALLILSRLSLLQVKGWDNDLVKQEVSFCTILDQITEKLECIVPLSPAGHDSRFVRTCVKLRLIKRWFQEQNPVETEVSTGSMQSPDKTSPGGHTYSDMLQADLTNNRLDGDFWEELMNDFPPLTF